MRRMVRQVVAKKVPRSPLLGHVSVGQLDHVIFALRDADVDEDVVAEPVCYHQRIIHPSLSSKVPCSLPTAPRWFDGLTMEEIRTATLELLIQNERRWGTLFAILAQPLSGQQGRENQACKRESNRNVV